MVHLRRERVQALQRDPVHPRMECRAGAGERTGCCVGSVAPRVLKNLAAFTRWSLSPLRKRPSRAASMVGAGTLSSAACCTVHLPAYSKRRVNHWVCCAEPSQSAQNRLTVLSKPHTATCCTVHLPAYRTTRIAYWICCAEPSLTCSKQAHCIAQFPHSKLSARCSFCCPWHSLPQAYMLYRCESLRQGLPTHVIAVFCQGLQMLPRQ